MKSQLLFSLLLFICCAASCDKKSDLEKVSTDGIIIDANSEAPIPFAKVYLMSTTSIFFSSFGDWDIMDSLITDENGVFRFDFKISDDIERLGFYIQKEHYFDYQHVKDIDLPQIKEGVSLYLSPKSYLEIRVLDEAPFSEYKSMHIPPLLSQPNLEITGNPIDTTVVMWLHGDESLLMGWFYHNDDSTWVSESSNYVSCPSFDTCYYEILF